MIGFVAPALFGFIKAYRATGDSTNFPLPCNMTHKPADYRPFIARSFLTTIGERHARHLSSYARKVAYDTRNGLLLRVFERRQHLKSVL